MNLGQLKTLEEKRQEVNKQRIQEIDRIRKLNERESKANEDIIDEDSKPYDKYEDEEYREPLSIETKIEKTILLSWGGGSDGFKLYFNEDKELLNGVYFMADWGEYQETDLTGEEAEEVYNFYMGGYIE